MLQGDRQGGRLAKGESEAGREAGRVREASWGGLPAALWQDCYWTSIQPQQASCCPAVLAASLTYTPMLVSAALGRTRRGTTLAPPRGPPLGEHRPRSSVAGSGLSLTTLWSLPAD